MSRKKTVIHEEAVLLWHMNNEYSQNSRENKIVRGLAQEEDFNDIFAQSCATDDPELLCFSLR